MFFEGFVEVLGVVVKEGLEFVGFYYLYFEGFVVLSEVDRDVVWFEVSYLVFFFEVGCVVEVWSWCFEEGGGFIEEFLRIMLSLV